MDSIIDDLPAQMEQEIYSVSELNQASRSLLETKFPAIWVEGEISNLVQPASGHLYFSLKDSDAQVRCALFRFRRHHLNFKPENGLQVLVQGKVSLYENRGDYQLLVSAMEPAGDGALQRAFEALKKKLAQAGLFAAEAKLSLPTLPKQIGVITSATGAAVRDVLSVLKRRFPSIPVVIYPSEVQGKTAAAQLVKAIATANQRQECDVLILTRGGGSLEDLWPFNEEILAHAIHQSALPIISAVGHEIDFTIADFVADQRAATPSAAAELVVPDQSHWLHQFDKLSQRLLYRLQQQLQNCRQLLQHARQRLQHPGQRLAQVAQRLDHLEQQLVSQLQLKLQRWQQTLSVLARALDAISPLATLQRGYAIVQQQSGTVVRSCQELAPQETIITRLIDGKVESQITAIELAQES